MHLHPLQSSNTIQNNQHVQEDLVGEGDILQDSGQVRLDRDTGHRPRVEESDRVPQRVIGAVVLMDQLREQARDDQEGILDGVVDHIKHRGSVVVVEDGHSVAGGGGRGGEG